MNGASLKTAQTIGGTVLDQAQKLGGRGFLIAAFIPALLFVAVIIYLLWGIDSLQQGVRELAEQGWKRSVLHILIGFVCIYLLAYVLYGIRGFLYEFLQGEWPVAPLKWLRPVFLALEARAFRRRQSILVQKINALNDPYWATEKAFGPFNPTSRAIVMKATEARPMLQNVYNSHQNLIQRLATGHKWKEKKYWDILRKARRLQAKENRSKFPIELQMEIDQLVAIIKAEHEANYLLRITTDRFKALALREWDAAYNDRYGNFPKNERWLRPTRLGNAVSTLESYPLDRYGIDLGTLWPRLVQVIPDSARLRIEEANIYVDFTVMMTLLSFAAAVSVIVFYFSGLPWRLPHSQGWIIFHLVLLLLSSWTFYHLVVQATRAFGNQICATIDLYRLKLLDALEIKRPGTLREEQDIWKKIGSFIAQADVPTEDIRFKTVGEKSESGNTLATSAELLTTLRLHELFRETLQHSRRG
jgi:hypothetical protein